MFSSFWVNFWSYGYVQWVLEGVPDNLSDKKPNALFTDVNRVLHLQKTHSTYSQIGFEQDLFPTHLHSPVNLCTRMMIIH